LLRHSRLMPLYMLTNATDSYNAWTSTQGCTGALDIHGYNVLALLETITDLHKIC